MGNKNKKVKKSKSKKTKSKPQQYVATTTTSQVTTTSLQTSDTEDQDDDDANAKDSLENLDERNEWEKMLFEYVESGKDRQTVRDLITANHSRIDINHRNKSNQDILTKAVEKKDEKMIKLLLRVDPENIDTRNALLSAIKDGDMHVMLLLLAFEDASNRTGGSPWAGARTKAKKGHLKQMDEFDNTEYGKHITPLGMAAKSGHYEIIQVLWNRGERLPQLHMPSCDCSTCKKETRELEKIKTRLNLLKAKCNPTYLIFLAGQDGSFDPVYESLQLMETLDKCISEEPEFKEQYETIKKELQKFPTALLNLCRTTEETKIFLSQRQGYVGADLPYPRLAYAFECDQKSLVAHPNAQYLLYREWRGHSWSPENPVANWLLTIITMLCFPIVNMFLWLSLFCGSSVPITQHFLAPINRCRSKWASHLAFCILLFYMNAEERTEAQISPPTLCKYNSLQKNQKMEFEATIPRRRLPSTDPLLLGECTLAISTVCAGIRLLRVLILNQNVGPLQCAFMKMSGNLKTFAIFYIVAVGTYALGTQILFRPYQNLTKIDNNETKYAPTNFNNIEDSMETFFWSFFSGLKKENMEIFTPKREFINSQGKLEVVEQPQTTTQFTATLIQMWLFSNTQETILGEDKDTNWKYKRTQEWMYHIQDTYLAPPFNLLPNGSCLLNVCSWISAVTCSKRGSKEAGCDMEQCCFMRDVESPQDQHDSRREYPFLLRKLFQRYFQYVMWEESEESKPEKKDVSTIQESVIELRKMTEELLQKMEGNNGDQSTPPGQSRYVVTSTPKSGIEVIMNPKPNTRTDSL
ncbi:unnamed protein product [Orchesella dallaii]|uniref:Transient receptor ion channel domain-containing protein n=1 Tax=Orchesella dallaii TaxID=48710 RepID=A0ABP1PK68_9HEXA